MANSKLFGSIDSALEASVFGGTYRRYVRPTLLNAGIWLPFRGARAWRTRISDVVSSSDNAHIPRVPGAGSIFEGRQLMHNGLSIGTGSYYGFPILLMLQSNKGVHEPQEERAFQEVLRFIEPGATMIELGSYWAFYSMWFHSRIENSKCYLVEPDQDNMISGKDNFELNRLTGTFVHAFVGREAGTDERGARTVSVDSLAMEYDIRHIAVLHSDVQGAEYEMLQGASECFRRGMIDYVFVSTHSDRLHSDCEEFLRAQEFIILASAGLTESFSVDGVIVARAPQTRGPDAVPISKKASR